MRHQGTREEGDGIRSGPTTSWLQVSSEKEKEEDVKHNVAYISVSKSVLCCLSLFLNAFNFHFSNVHSDTCYMDLYHS